jgi:hypothetical protein
MFRSNPRDLIGGGLFAALGAAVLAGAADYRIGTPGDMGPGFFPMGLGVLAIVVGLAIIFLGLAERGTIPSIAWRQLIAVLAAIAVFGLVIERFGLIPAVFLSVGVSALGDRSSRPVASVMLATGFSVLTWLVFSVGLGVTMPAFDWPW